MDVVVFIVVELIIVESSDCPVKLKTFLAILLLVIVFAIVRVCLAESAVSFSPWVPFRLRFFFVCVLEVVTGSQVTSAHT